MDFRRDIESRLSTVERRAGVGASFILEGSAADVPEAWRKELFRIAIEALNNAMKHAQAHIVEVTLRCVPPAFELEISDDGVGFTPDRPRAGGMGLRTMRERAELLGGTLDIRSAPGKGSTVSVLVEIKEKP